MGQGRGRRGRAGSNSNCPFKNKININNYNDDESKNENEKERESENENESGNEKYETENNSQLKGRENHRDINKRKEEKGTEIIYSNIRSLNNKKMPLIKALLQENTVMMLTETWGNTLDELKSQVRQKNRHNSRGGGVLIAVPQIWEIMEEGTVCEEGDDMYLRAKIGRDRVAWLIVMYIAPEKSKLKAINKLAKFITDILQKEKSPSIIVAGDFNIDLLNPKTPREELEIAGLIQTGLTINDYGTTCFRSKQGSRIDFILTSNKIQVSYKEPT